MARTVQRSAFCQMVAHCPWPALSRAVCHLSEGGPLPLASTLQRSAVCRRVALCHWPALSSGLPSVGGWPAFSSSLPSVRGCPLPLASALQQSAICERVAPCPWPALSSGLPSGRGYPPPLGECSPFGSGWSDFLTNPYFLLGNVLNTYKTVTDLVTDFTMCQHSMTFQLTFPFSRQYHH